MCFVGWVLVGFFFSFFAVSCFLRWALGARVVWVGIVWLITTVWLILAWNCVGMYGVAGFIMRNANFLVQMLISISICARIVGLRRLCLRVRARSRLMGRR